VEQTEGKGPLKEPGSRRKSNFKIHRT